MTLYDAGEDRARFFLVLEFIDGKSLDELIQAGPLPVEPAIAIAVQIASALDAAHHLGIVHRDIKPANILVTSAGVVKYRISESRS